MPDDDPRPFVAEARSIKASLASATEAAQAHAARFDELARSLHAGSIRSDFPWEYCDLAQARELLEQIPLLRARLRNLEDRLKRSIALD